MNISTLDFIFPFVVFFYGFLLVFVLEMPAIVGLGHERARQLLQHLEPKRKFAWVCLCVGAAWSLQNLLFA